MFNKLKQFRDLRNQAKTIQNKLSQEIVSCEKSGVLIMMNGNLEITAIMINENLSGNKLADAIKECANEAIKKTQKLMAQKMREMGGLENFRF